LSRLKTAVERAVARHGVDVTYTHLDSPMVEVVIKAANVSFQERPADSDVPMTQMAMRWLVLADDLRAVGIERPFEGDRLTLSDPALILTINRYGPGIDKGKIICWHLEATGR